MQDHQQQTTAATRHRRGDGATGAGPILLCYDGSPAAAAAMSVAAELFGPDREALVLAAWSSPHRGSSPAGRRAVTAVTSGREAQMRASAEELAEIAVAIARDSGFDARPMTVRRDQSVWSTIIEIGDREQSAVIVVGARGLGSVRRAMLGSVSDQVARRANRPVLVVHGGPGPRVAATGPVLLCDDGSPYGAEAIRAAGRCLPPGRRALAVTVWARPSRHARAGISGLPGRAPDMRGFDDGELGTAEATADRAVRIAGQAGFDAEPLIVEQGASTAAETIIRVANEHDASLIVTGARGHGGVSRLLLGSVSSGLLRHADQPVLVGRPHDS